MMAQKPSAPASAAARAMAPISGVLGVSLGITGMSTTAFTALTISATMSGSWPMAMP